MLRLVYVWHNMTRNLLRTLLTCAAVALPIVIYVLSVAVIDGLNLYLDNAARQLRLAVTHKASLANSLPLGYRAKMEALDPGRQRLQSVCGIRWIGGKVANDQQPLSTLGVDADTFAATFPEYLAAPGEREAWQRERRAIVVGSAIARRFGWKVGDRITIFPSVPPYTGMEFTVVSTAQGVADPVTNFFRLDYLLEELKRHGYTSEESDFVNFYFVKTKSRPALDSLRQEIDAHFARSPDETSTLDEKTFMTNLITQQFNLPRNLAILSGVTVLVAVLAAANTMSMNFRDRMNEFATLKAMGFGGGFTFALVQIEALLVCGLGGVAGALLPYAAFTHTPLRNWTIPVIQSLDIRPVVLAYALAISLAIGLVAALAPSVMALRMRVVTSLRNLE